MKTYKLKGLDYCVINAFNAYHAATECLKHKIGVTPDNLVEILKQDIRDNWVIFDCNE